MKTYTKDQQEKHRAALIEEFGYTAWGFLVRADWARRNSLPPVQRQIADTRKRIEDISKELADIEKSLVAHTDESRTKKNALKEEKQRLFDFLQNGENSLTFKMNAVIKAITEAEIEAGVALAMREHARTFEYKEEETVKAGDVPPDTL